MTDSSDPRRPKSSRKKPSREPATIDLKATVIDDGTPQDPAQGSTGEDAANDVRIHETAPQESPPAETLQGAEAEETIAGGAQPPAEDVVASPEATLDSGAGTDTLPTGDPSLPPSMQDANSQDTSSQEAPYREASSHESASQDVPPQEPLSGGVPPQPAPGRRSSAGALIGSGLLGGLVGAGLVYGLQTWQAPPAQDDQRIAQLEQRVSALRQPSPSGQPQANTQALEERLQALESSRGDLDGRLQALQGTAEQASAQAQEALNRPAPEAAPAAAAPQNEAALNDLSTRLSTLEEQVRTSTQNAANVANTAQDLDRRIADQDRRLTEQQQRAAQLDGRFAEVERRFTEADRRFTETDRRFSEQEQRVTALTQQVAENNRNAEQAGQTGAKVVLAGRLNDALSSGEPYAEVLDGIRKAGTDAARIAPLEPFAGQGAPTAAKLAEGFEPVETRILRESRGPANDWTDRILRMADRVVTVRPVNEQDSAGVSGSVTRIRQALEKGDVVDAAAAWDSLPEPSRRLSEDWGRQLKAVAQAHQAAQAIGSDALATLNRTTQ